MQEAKGASQTTSHQLAATEERYRVRYDMFNHGEAIFVEMTDARNEQTRARFNTIYAHIGMHIVYIRLQYAIGQSSTHPSFP
ncbi:hypothetical protein [Pajaroellobacter abortibovis]|uniref:Uncharacterized protein n=1 Tax=Pajaroellobacter abortibovis TaxID=1882918 RepID=A0A1L6MUZ5_9BACT|nr:hypothetical protein [Pajaroellobacter abortibovis]APR99338.1 hypothetical protein BCY86_00585 [Pajaroellobacter abortibovis]